MEKTAFFTNESMKKLNDDLMQWQRDNPEYTIVQRFHQLTFSPGINKMDKVHNVFLFYTFTEKVPETQTKIKRKAPRSK